MVIKCPFQCPLPEPKPIHEFLMQIFDQYDQSSIIFQEHEDPTKKVTFGQLRSLTYSIANTLRNRFGFRKCDTALTYMENRIEFPILFMAVSAAGGATSGANQMYTFEELGRQLADSGARFIVTTAARIDAVEKAINSIQKSNQIESIFIIDPFQIKSINGIPLIPFNDLYEITSPINTPIHIDPKKDVVLLPYSSGTTGLPKGVMLSHYNLQNVLFARHTLGAFPNAEHGQMIIQFLPFFHMAGMLGLLSTIYNGICTVIMRHFDPSQYLGLVQKYKVSAISAVPSALVFLAKHPSVTKYDLASVKMIRFGGASAGRELLEAVAKRLPNLECFAQSYGLTESGGLASATPRISYSQCPLGSCGFPIPNMQLKIMSIDGKNEELGPLSQGEIWLRGPSNMLGYHNNPKATAEILDTEGWLRTGDIGYYDFFGHIYIVDRLKELIKYKGYQVPPSELEDVLLKHPSIQEVAVTGIPDKSNPDVGELPTAFVVLKSGHMANDETAASIKQIVADHLAPYKHLRGGVVFMKLLPKSGAGKVLRRQLRDANHEAYGQDKNRSKL